MLYQLTYEIVTQFNYVMWYSWMMNFISQFPPMWWIEIVSTMGEMKSYYTASFWNITIQWTSHDDLTEFFLSWNQSVKKVTQMIWHIFFLRVLFQMKKCLQNLQINLEAKRMDGFSWKKNSIISVFTLFVAA